MRKFFGFFAAAVAMSLAAGCGGNTTNKPVGSGNQKPTGEPIKIGVILPTSGPIATFGEESMNGLRMALKDKAIGDRPIELILYNNNGTPNESGAGATKLIQQDGVLGIIGCVASSNTLQAGKIADSEGVPLLTPASTNESIAGPTGIGSTADGPGKYVSRICFNDNMQGAACAKAAKKVIEKAGKPLTAALLFDTKQDYCVGLANSFRRTFQELGGQIVIEQSYSTGDTQFAPQISAIQQKQPSVIFIPGYYDEVGSVLKQAKEQWAGIPIFGGDGWDSPNLNDLSGGALNVLECYICTHFVAEDPAEDIQAFVKQYKAVSNGQAPGAMAALGYDVGLVIFDALTRAASAEGGISRETLRDAIRQTKDIAGITGKITVNADGNCDKNPVIAKVTPTGFSFSGISID